MCYFNRQPQVINDIIFGDCDRRTGERHEVLNLADESGDVSTWQTDDNHHHHHREVLTDRCAPP